MIITRRFWLTSGYLGPAMSIDVRTSDRVSHAQAQANAEDLFRRKMGKRPVFVTRSRTRKSKPHYTIGPRR